MYARLLLESLRRGTRRKLLAVTAVCLGTLGATALSEVLLASGDRLAAEMSSYGANLEIDAAPAAPAPRDGELLAVARLGEVRRIFWRNNIVALAPLLPLRVRFVSARGTAVVAEAVGTWFDHPLDEGLRTGLPHTRPTLSVAGRWPAEPASPGEAAGKAKGAEATGPAEAARVTGTRTGAADAAGPASAEAVLGRRLAARLGVAIGGRIRATLGGRAAALTVTGIAASGGEEDDQALVPLAVVQRLAARPGRYLRAEVYAQTNPESRNVRDPRSMTPQEYDAWYCTAYPSSVAFQIGQALPEARVRVVHGVTAATADVLGRLRGVLLVLALVALLGAAVGVTAAMTATVLERRLEAGLMVAIGAARRRVVLFFLSEAALLGGLGGLIGGALGLAAGRLLGAGALGVRVAWMPVLLPFAVLLGVALALLASAVPVGRALGRYPATLLKRANA